MLENIVKGERERERERERDGIKRRGQFVLNPLVLLL
jgi:hypothetical protein